MRKRFMTMRSTVTCLVISPMNTCASLACHLGPGCGSCVPLLRSVPVNTAPAGAGIMHRSLGGEAERRQIDGDVLRSCGLDRARRRVLIPRICVRSSLPITALSTEVVAGFDGFVAKYMGDGVLVYFGYPRAHEDDAERAVRAGLAARSPQSVASMSEPPNCKRASGSPPGWWSSAT